LGLPEARKLCAEIIGVKPEETMVGNNASLSIISKVLMWALLRGLVGSPRPWCQINKPKMIVTVPGYDRHFTLLAETGFELIQVKMTQEGPDMAQVEKSPRQIRQSRELFLSRLIPIPQEIRFLMRR